MLSKYERYCFIPREATRKIRELSILIRQPLSLNQYNYVIHPTNKRAELKLMAAQSMYSRHKREKEYLRYVSTISRVLKTAVTAEKSCCCY